MHVRIQADKASKKQGILGPTLVPASAISYGGRECFVVYQKRLNVC